MPEATGDGSQAIVVKALHRACNKAESVKIASHLSGGIPDALCLLDARASTDWRVKIRSTTVHHEVQLAINKMCKGGRTGVNCLRQSTTVLMAVLLCLVQLCIPHQRWLSSRHVLYKISH